MTQFKVGDKVSALATDRMSATTVGVKVGDVLTITRFGGNKTRYIYAENGDKRGYFAPNAVELVSDKPSKKQRLTDAEKRIAELEAKVEALGLKSSEINVLQAQVAELEKAQKLPVTTLADAVARYNAKTPNEQRKAIIAEARAFVAVKSEYIKDSTRTSGGYKRKVIENPKYSHMAAEEVVFHTNGKKRVVTAVVKYSDGEVMTKAIAKCAPDDVFNADIGKAIALGRALGLDVKRFEQAVKPTEYVAGQIIEVFEVTGNGKRYLIGKAKEVKKQDRIIFYEESAQVFNGNSPNFAAAIGVYEDAIIIDDTEAQY